MQQAFYTADDLAKLFKVSRRTAVRRMVRGEIRSFRFGRLLRCTPAAVNEYVKASTSRYRRECHPRKDS